MENIKPGPPKRFPVPVDIRVTEAQAASLDATGLSRSEAIRQAIDHSYGPNRERVMVRRVMRQPFVLDERP